MKALTVRQPYATLIVHGIKRIETRTWQTSYRGPLMIHAASGIPLMPPVNSSAHELLLQVLYKLGYASTIHLPRGMALGHVSLVTCRRSESLVIGVDLSEDEFHLGDYSPKRFAWMLMEPRIFKSPVEIKGKLGIWTFLEEKTRREAR